MTKFGEKMRLIRTKHGLSRRQLSDWVGCGSNVVWKVENGVVKPSTKTQRRVMKALVAKAQELLADVRELREVLHE